jgi:peptide/nickel transport system substrate-binding protein
MKISRSVITRAGSGAVLLILGLISLAPAAKVDSTLQRGGELRFAIRGEPKSLDPHTISDEPSEIVQYLTGGVLVRLNRATQVVEPGLAAQWKMLENGKAVEFRLRHGLKFSDGTPFTAADVAFTIARINDRSLKSPIADTLRSGAGDITAEVRSPDTVIVRVPAPVANLPDLFDQLTILSAKSAKPMTATLGPFEMAEYKSGSHVMLRRNPNYWKKSESGQQLPYLDAIRLDIQTNRELEMMRFRRGELHLLTAIDAENFERLSNEGNPAARDLGPSLDSEQFWFNQVPGAPIPAYKVEWFSSTEFRRAISHAINREDLCRLVYRGHARPAGGFVSPANRVWHNSKVQPPEYSPKLALALLNQLGFRQQNGVLVDQGGRPVEFSVITNAGNKSRERMAALIQQDLAKIGIKLNIVPLDFPSLIERITRNFQYEACLLGQNVDADPNTQLNVWRSSAPNHQWNPSQKTPATPWEAEIDRLLDQQAAATDHKKRKAAFDRVQDIVAQQQPFIYLVHKNALVAISPKVLNAQPAVLRPQTYWNADSIAINAAPSR